MKLLVIILHKTELLNDLLSILVEVGITKATIFESEGLGNHIAQEIPIFAGLKSLIGTSQTYNKTILALINDGSPFIEFKKLLKETDLDFSKEGTGVIFTVDIDNVVKSPEH